jgi:hypothetical protein
MDDTAPSEKNLPVDLNKIDLSQLQGFSFGTQWVQDKSAPSDRRAGDDRPRREDRRDGPGPGGAVDRRDRRAFRKPMPGPGGDNTGGAAPSEPGAGSGAGGIPRQEFSGDQRARRDGPGEYRGGGGLRREGPGGPGGDRGGPRYGGRNEQMDRGPYESPYFIATFYPEDTSFNTLVKTIRASCRTIELFEVARTVVGKPDRFVVVMSRRPSGDGAPGTIQEADKRPFFISVPDGLPFESEEAALAHVLSKHLGNFFDTAEVEIDPPKGNFQVVNRCGVTGELLGPPNYHRYNQLVQQHHAAKVARMPFETFRARIESVREPEAIQAWLDKMKKTTRYTWKNPAAPVAKSPAAPVESTAEPVSAPAAEAPPPAADDSASTPAPAATPEAVVAAPAPAVNFDSFDDARVYLLANAKDKLVRPVENARLHGKNLEILPQGEIYRTIEGALERQRRFPLDTANALRGRLRREHFTIFKKGSKGVSYVCAVKRKFRVPGQMFSESIGSLISFIEEHPMIRASELAKKLLLIAAPADAAPGVEQVVSIEQREKLARMQGDLAWLVREGYVTEFIDGALYAAAPMAESRKREVEASEHDPENFPDARVTPVAQIVVPPAVDPAPVATVAVETPTPAAEPVLAELPVVEPPPATA